MPLRTRLPSALLLLAMAAGPSCRPAAVGDAPLLSLDAARHAAGETVRVRGRLGLYENQTRIGYVQDAASGLLLEAETSVSVPAVGSSVEIVGVVERLGAHSRLRAQRFHILPAVAPDPEIPVALSLDDPAREGTWMAADGIVTGVRESDDKRTHALSIRGESGTFTACMAEPKDRPVGRADILGFRVRAEGVRVAPADPAFAAGCTLRLPSRGYLRILQDAPFAPQPPPPTDVRAIRSLSPAEARKRHPVRIHGVVTAYDADKNLLFVQDQTGGIYVEAWRHLYDLRPGQSVDISGWTDAGAFAPIVIWPRVRVVGTAAFPCPIRLETALVPYADAQWVELHGIVRDARVDARRAELLVVAYGERLQVDLPGAVDQARVAALVDAEVRLRGVYRAKVSATRQVVGTSVSVPSLDLVDVTTPAPADPFAAEIRRSDSVLDFEPQQGVGHRVHVRGVVTLHQPGRFLYLRDDGGPLRVESRDLAPLLAGTRVDVVGFPAVGRHRPALVDGSYRTRGEHETLAPRVVAADRPVSPAQDGELITIEGRLLERLSPEGESRLVLESSLYLFEAVLPSAEPALPDLRTGSRVRATGVCVVRGEGEVPRSFQLLLRGPEDVVLMARAPWWNMRRAGVALAGVLTIAVVALVWVVALRRTVHEQTAVLRARLAREAALEERARLARELHDSLEQNLAGIGYALQAIKETIGHPRLAHSHLDRALRHVDESMAEARRSVQALRPRSLSGGDLPSALRRLADELTRGGVARTEAHVDGDSWPLRPAVEDHLFRIAQEAVTNALKHARPQHVGLALRYGDTSLRLAVTDDGAGFDTTSAVSAGHFGLSGMRERASAVGASLSVESTPGAGTTVTVDVVRDRAALQQVS